ncbi:MAG TPA: hypothetical protein VGG07_24785 [Solirubrobacteraceae bacterium]|jgi:hypothetical protein
MHDRLMRSWVNLLGDGARDAGLGDRLTRAVEGDRKVYDALSPEAKYIVDSYRLIKASTRRAARDAGYEIGELPNYLPRLIKRAPGEAGDAGRDIRSLGSSGDLQGQARKARRLRAELGVYHPDDDPEVEREAVILRQAYDTVHEANDAVSRQRGRWITSALDPTQDVRDLEGKEAVAAIRKLYASDPGAAARLAHDQAQGLFPELETNFLQIANRSVGRQIAAIQSHQAVTRLRDSMGVIKGASDQVPRALAQRLSEVSQRDAEQLRALGYGESNSAWFKGVLFHPDFLKLLKRSEDLRASMTNASGWAKHLNTIEGLFVKMIMYSPMIHGLNIAGRMGTAWMSHPLLMTKFVTRAGRRGAGETLRGFLNPDDMARDAESMHLTADAVRAGVKLPDITNPAGEMLRRLGDDVGDGAVQEAPYVTDADSIDASHVRKGLDTLRKLGAPIVSGWDHANALLWGNVRDFGVMMYHVEHEGLLRMGYSEDVARPLAARRANSWMGMVAPEDANPMTHALARLTMFAPNWWRTWGELLTGIYRDSGFHWTPARVAGQIGNDLRVGMAALMFQKLSGNAMNYAMSGHLQEQNQPGNRFPALRASWWLYAPPSATPRASAAWRASAGLTRL